MMKYYIKVFGCQMNQSDAERISAFLEKYKFKKASSIDEANLIIFVTCGVRQSAEDRVYGQINNIKKKYPEKEIILTGCLAHRKDVQRRLKGKVDLFCEMNNFPKEILPVIARSKTMKQSRVIQEKTRLLRCTRNDKEDYLLINPKYSNSYTAYIPIMTGCDNFCSYCVVPYARGREYSRPAEDILKEIKTLVKKGCKEIILLGQNVNSYRSELKIKNLEIKKLFKNSKFKIQNSSRINFAKLLKLINTIPGHFWISFLTSHPKDMSDELIKTIAKSLSTSGGQKICEYISLPVQSGDNEILRKMNRHYTIEHYRNLVRKIRTAFSPAISTDIIVGFPSETKKQFENTAKLLRELKFDMAYIAQYSPRPETTAWKMKDNVSKTEKERREKVLTKILEKTALENNKKYAGKVVEVLIDKKLSPKAEPWGSLRFGLGKSTYLAHTRTQKKVIFQSNKKILVGSFVKVQITKARAFGLEGKLK